MRGIYVYMLLLLTVNSAVCMAEGGHLRLAPVFTDNMVLQRGKPIHIWGSGLPGWKVEGFFGNEHVTAVTGGDGRWSVYFSSHAANERGMDLRVRSGADSLGLKNVLVGDIWLCLGQSNMEFPMGGEMHFASEKAEGVLSGGNGLLRWYNPVYTGKNEYGRRYTDSMLQRLTPERFYEGSWETCDSGTMRAMSAVGYYFGEKIAMTEHVPVGLINLAIGGCPIETFMNPAVLQRDRLFAAKMKGNWLYNDALPVWVRERGMQNLGSVTGGDGDGLGPDHGYKPGFAYRAGIEPLLPMAIKGILWYQGESNAQELVRVEEYPRMFRMMIEDFRQQWRQPNLPFYWVQLSSIDTAHYASKLWPLFRDGQRQSMDEIPYGGMAVCSDIGARDDVHPKNKRDVGERLARLALAADYDKRQVVNGPLIRDAFYRPAAVGGGEVVVTFGDAKDLATGDGQVLKGFSTDGLVDAAAFIRGGRVVIPVKERPDTVYYGWKPYSEGNLVNGAGLPASTFRYVIGREPGIDSARAEKVFRSGEDGYMSYRIPAVLGLTDRHLLAFCEGRVGGVDDYGNIDIVMKHSMDGGRTWSALQVVADNGALQAGNAAPVVDRTDPRYPAGRIFLFYNTGNAHEGEVRNGKGRREVWYKTSEDNGVSWSDPVNITASVMATGDDWRSYANTPGHAMQFMRGRYKGRMFVAANHSAGGPRPGFADYRAHGYFTDDHGVTFHLGATVAVDGGNESMAVELSGGRLMMNSRNQHGQPRARIVSVSSDGGSHWDSSGFDRQLPDPVNQGSILGIGWKKGKAVIAFCNDADTAKRDNLTLRISYDEGRSWPKQYVVDRSTSGAVHGYTGYSDLVQLGFSVIGVLYERAEYSEIVFKRLNIR